MLGFGFLLGVVKFGLLFVRLDLGMPAGLSSLLLQLQVIFTIVFAGFVLRERPRRQQMAGAAVAFAGLAVIGIDRAASAPILPFLLILAAAAAWGVTNVITRVAQPPDPLAMLVWASLVPPLPLLGLSLLFEGPAEIGDALAGTDAAGARRARLRRACQRAVRLRGLDDAAQAPHGRGGHAVRAARAGVRDGERGAGAGRAPERARARRRGVDLRRAGGDAAAGARARAGGRGGRGGVARNTREACGRPEACLTSLAAPFRSPP